ncbi:hypothetical protein [Leifsonia sp. fls2-241-R2A-40a]|uniref:hypothetical protein n=1 Tax=Leifsonia sp. fls2-241-R2A-40a TaxID=3040290 RepID=UPI0025508FC5|nr:hypothetical protein [Leifsonia sp. fls2-241-R2A-40a]
MKQLIGALSERAVDVTESSWERQRGRSPPSMSGTRRNISPMSTRPDFIADGIQKQPSADRLAMVNVLTILDVDGVVLRQPPRPHVKHPQYEDAEGRVYDLDGSIAWRSWTSRSKMALRPGWSSHG